MQRLGMTGWISEEQKIENQLARYGVNLTDVRYVLHTHNHIDHAGQDDRFPMTTTVCMQRKELEHSVSGLMTEQYPAEYVKHHVDRLHTPVRCASSISSSPGRSSWCPAFASSTPAGIPRGR